jgi:carbonic anhydrase/acetyltransferase-like protein (isoleucine patch superfamily)
MRYDGAGWRRIQGKCPHKIRIVRSFEDDVPSIADSADVDESAVVIGDVVIEEEASVWPNTTLRGDNGQIVVGEQVNVQDNAIVHEGMTLGPRRTLGHGAIVHAATVGKGAIVAAGSVVTEGTTVESGTLAAGSPAEPKTEVDPSETARTADVYVDLVERHATNSERVN